MLLVLLSLFQPAAPCSPTYLWLWLICCCFGAGEDVRCTLTASGVVSIAWNTSCKTPGVWVPCQHLFPGHLGFLCFLRCWCPSLYTLAKVLVNEGMMNPCFSYRAEADAAALAGDLSVFMGLKQQSGTWGCVWAVLAYGDLNIPDPKCSTRTKICNTARQELGVIWGHLWATGVTWSGCCSRYFTYFKQAQAECLRLPSVLGTGLAALPGARKHHPQQVGGQWLHDFMANLAESYAVDPPPVVLVATGLDPDHLAFQGKIFLVRFWESVWISGISSSTALSMCEPVSGSAVWCLRPEEPPASERTFFTQFIATIYSNENKRWCLYVETLHSLLSAPLILAGSVTPWNDVNIQVHLSTLLLKVFFSDAKRVASELHVMQASTEARGRLLGGSAQSQGSRGLPIPCFCLLLCSQQQHPTLLVHQHHWPCCEWIQLKNKTEQRFLGG